ncbi:MAG: hypothetical protein U9R19_05790 [Bacteroidota bacterium]|nr:hypothetical protein [Bacteroidota bacterium]
MLQLIKKEFDLFKQFKINNIGAFNALIIFIVLIFFIPTLFITWQSASPYCRADDWRFVSLYLVPFYEGSFGFRNLFTDPVHPMPLYSALYIASAKFFNLQIHYIARGTIFFQLFYGLVIISAAIKSFRGLNLKKTTILLYVVILCAAIFSFVYRTAYSWPIMTHCFAGLFLISFAGFFSELFLLNKNISVFKLVLTGIIVLLLSLTFFDWAVIFLLSLISVLLIVGIIKKGERKKTGILSITLLIPLIIVFALMSFVFTNTSRASHLNISEFIPLLFNNFFLMIKSISTGLFAGILNFQLFTDDWVVNSDIYIVFSIIFLLTYVAVLILFFTKKLYEKSVLPPAMMLFSLIFILSVLLFRYNPVEKGVFCLIIPRYVMFYQIGIVGFCWSVLLLIAAMSKKWIEPEKKLLTIAVILTIIVLSYWGQNYLRVYKISEFLKSKYPEVSQNIRDKQYDNNIEATWSFLSGIDITVQIKFLNDHKLNVFAPNYPYPDMAKKISE